MATTEELRTRLQRAVDNTLKLRAKTQSVSREIRGEPEPEFPETMIEAPQSQDEIA